MTRRAARNRGRRAETIAALWLRLKCYAILARGYATREGEIDIIAQRGRTIVFVEVKARATREAALAAITPEKTRRMARAARRWLAHHPAARRCALRGDALLLTPGRRPRHLEDAFTLDLGAM